MTSGNTALNLLVIEQPNFMETERLRIDTEIAGLDSRILELELARAALKKTRNTLTSISRLSQDIFRSIFQEVQDEHGMTSHKEAVFPYFRLELESQMPWVRALTHVCSHWRELALNTPTLWTHVQLNNIGLASDMLVRSRTAPLSITATFPYSNHKASEQLQKYIPQALRMHLHHTTFIDLRLPHDWYEELYTAISQSTITPNTLEACSFRAIDLHDLASFPVDLPVDVVVKSASSLRHITLDMCAFPLNPSSTRVSFSCLSSLQIRCGPTHCVEFLDLLSLPITCSVYIVSWTRNHSSLHPFVRGFWEDSNRVLFSLAFGPLEMEYMPDLLMAFMDKDPTKGTLKIRLDKVHPLGDSTGARVYTSFFSLVPLHCMTHLAVHGSLENTFWTYIGESCLQVTHLHVRIDNPYFLCMLINIRDQVPTLETSAGLTLDPSAGEAALAANSIRLPMLAHITFANMEVPKMEFELLGESLIVRRLVGKPLHSLTFNDVFDVETEQAFGLTQYITGEISWWRSNPGED
ncbi:hypothetical protein BDN72DRAFT_957430 [Pluteus cervinus]|uniref:Uncharacterized protein n=1 Tax=Pluteus cervinus TaxID=181527 RepID=A0ACD3B3N1_9AGAR|nr:hypothetical protein BDN72DRAFT_957430 [Pluteus cervinus]